MMRTTAAMAATMGMTVGMALAVTGCERAPPTQAEIIEDEADSRADVLDGQADALRDQAQALDKQARQLNDQADTIRDAGKANAAMERKGLAQPTAAPVAAPAEDASPDEGAVTSR